jgi:hemoglobin-like flavoprotein
MHLQKQLRIPERSIQTSETWAWQRFHRQIFGLADGRRDAQRIAQLLHKPLVSVEDTIVELQQAGYMSLRSERKVVVMNVQLLKESFDMIVPQKDAFAHSFYERLFTDYPQTQPLFAQTDMRRQEGALMATLAAVIAGVERGDNLVSTLQHYLGSRFTPEMQDAWTEAYEIISAQMQEGAKAASSHG